MIVGIVKTGLGIVQLEEFQFADDVSSAMGVFCQGFEDPADYLAFDTGFVDIIPNTTDGYVWAWNFDTSTLVEMPAPP